MIRRRSLSGLAAALAACSALAVLAERTIAQSADPLIVFDSPRDEGYASGATVIRVRFEPADIPVRGVSLFADGVLVCTLERPPFECPWNAGPLVTEHVLRATATLADGRRLARSIRTKGVEYTEAVDVDVVQITATVTSGRNRFVRGLGREAFRVYEDGVRQTITTFEAEDTPLEIVVAVDFSSSMKPAMPTVKNAIKKFLANLRSEDRVTILAFNNTVFTVAGPQADLAARIRAIDRLTPWGGTALYDVIVKSVGTLGQQSGRRAMVVFSDGEDLHSKTPLEVTERMLESSDAVVYAIGQGRARSLMNLRAVLERLAEKSGGRAFFDDLDGLDEVFHDIIADLSNQYLIGYTPEDTRKDGRWRDLRIEVPGTDYQVRARRGYRAVSK
jgi:VWFA-related protein